MGAPMLEGRRRGRRDPGRLARGRAHFAAPGRAAPDLRRPGRDRDRERAPVQRDQGGARTADRDGRDPAGHRRLGRPTSQPVFDAIASEREPAARRQLAAVCAIDGEAHAHRRRSRTARRERRRAASRAVGRPLGPRSQRAAPRPPTRPSTSLDRSGGRPIRARRDVARRAATASRAHVPLLREAGRSACISVHRREPRPFTTQPDRAAADLRRPGGDRDRERAPVQRDQGGARAADGDRRDPARDQQIADRRAAGLRRDRRARSRACAAAAVGVADAIRRRAAAHGRLPRRVGRGGGGHARRLPDEAGPGSITARADPDQGDRCRSPDVASTPSTG